MSKNPGRGARTLVAAALFLAAAVPSLATPPAKTISYAIHAVPSDPEAEVVFTVMLDLEPAEVDGDSVGWEVVSAIFIQGIRTDGSDPMWKIDEPAVDTADGLWWIDHADADTPEAGEFLEPPPMGGVAATTSQSDVKLEFEVQGAAYSPPPGGAPFATTAAVTHFFRRVGESEPEEEGTAEPVEVEEPVST